MAHTWMNFPFFCHISLTHRYPCNSFSSISLFDLPFRQLVLRLVAFFLCKMFSFIIGHHVNLLRSIWKRLKLNNNNILQNSKTSRRFEMLLQSESFRYWLGLSLQSRNSVFVTEEVPLIAINTVTCKANDIIFVSVSFDLT